MGSDAAGNRYYENRVDYPFGQHRWVEPGDIHNYDSSSVPPEWHGWMTSMNDAPPCAEADFINSTTEEKVLPLCESDAPDSHNVGHQEEMFNFHHMHDQSQVRSRGYGIGNSVVGLPPHEKDAYYTQPGSPYNDASIRPLEMIGSLDKDGGRAYKSEKWAERLKTAEEKASSNEKKVEELKSTLENIGSMSRKEMAARNRGLGTTLK